MEILPSTNIDFSSLAEKIASDFFDKGVPLDEGIIKVAKEKEFTPEEVTRLLEKTNTSASIRFLKTAENRKGTFILAEPEVVLRATHPTGETNEKTASLFTSNLTGVYTGIPKTKGVKPMVKVAKSESKAERDIDAVRACYTVKNEIESRQLKKIALEDNVKKDINFLTSEFSCNNGNDFSKFAADAFSLYGIRSVPTLIGISKTANKPIVKVASDGCIDDTTKHMQAMRSICENLTSITKLASEIDSLKTIYDKMYKALKKAVM